MPKLKRWSKKGENTWASDKGLGKVKIKRRATGDWSVQLYSGDELLENLALNVDTKKEAREIAISFIREYNQLLDSVFEEIEQIMGEFNPFGCMRDADMLREMLVNRDVKHNFDFYYDEVLSYM